MTLLDWILFHTGTALFAAAAGLGVWGMRQGRAIFIAGARAAAIAAAATLGLMLLRHGLEHRTFPVSNRFDTQVFSCVTLALLAVVIDLVRGLPILTIGAAPFCFVIALVAATLGMPSGGSPPPASAWVGVHVVATLIAYGLFALAFLSAILYLVEQRQLKSGGSTALLGFMPSLETFYRLLLGSLLVGTVLLTVGVVVGYLFARRQGLPPGWRTDPKIILTTVTWIAYVVVLGLAVAPGFKGRRTALASVGCFVLVMATLWLAAFWTGFHRYT